MRLSSAPAELNASFYRWPRPPAFRSWRHRLPDGFRLSVKAPRGLTHARRLYAPETWLQRIAAGWHELGGKRAVLLVQPPSSQARDDARLGCFLKLVPNCMRVAVEFRLLGVTELAAVVGVLADLWWHPLGLAAAAGMALLLLGALITHRRAADDGKRNGVGPARPRHHGRLPGHRA